LAIGHRFDMTMGFYMHISVRGSIGMLEKLAEGENQVFLVYYFVLLKCVERLVSNSGV
jgi:hypothetical protein